MPPLTFHCPLCQGVFQTETASAGQQVACPHCQGTVRVPETTEPVSLNPVPEPPQPVSTQSESIKQSPSQPIPTPKKRDPIKPSPTPTHAPNPKPPTGQTKPRTASALLPTVFNPKLPLAEVPLPLPSTSGETSPGRSQESGALESLPSASPSRISGKALAQRQILRSERIARQRKKSVLLALLAAVILAIALAILLNL